MTTPRTPSGHPGPRPLGYLAVAVGWAVLTVVAVACAALLPVLAFATEGIAEADGITAARGDVAETLGLVGLAVVVLPLVEGLLVLVTTQAAAHLGLAVLHLGRSLRREDADEPLSFTAQGLWTMYHPSSWVMLVPVRRTAGSDSLARWVYASLAPGRRTCRGAAAVGGAVAWTSIVLGWPAHPVLVVPAVALGAWGVVTLVREARATDLDASLYA
ncbi:hypothetical protein [Sanguibacter suaedae]|uniref:Uncharacterized protein n=1 Tax=Sanguibacter suaedae TaxID=2795737 RepID=A0A934I581_9MICO|nr:hypothetical protein [Sanguibacter suaedae]MBI9115819.1 hypothetical protein [Sanguibacter suaedae]